MKKFLSRKLLVAVLGVVVQVVLALGAPEEIVKTVAPTLAAVAVAFLAAQGWVDKEQVKGEAVSADLKTRLEKLETEKAA